MRKGNLTEQEVIAQIGDGAEQLLAYLLSKQPEKTNRDGYRGEAHGNAYTEWAASIAIPCTESKLYAYYYTDNAEDAIMAFKDANNSFMEWFLYGFEIR